MIRGYTDHDAKGWLRCRVLAFLDTQYYDDVKTEPTRFEGEAIRLIATADDGDVVGLLDIGIDGRAATIDSIAVHPDHRRALGYLHVHKEWDDEPNGFASPSGLSEPIRAFAHAPMEREAELRALFPRVYRCRQYLRSEPQVG
jgi:hypothetical protein